MKKEKSDEFHTKHKQCEIQVTTTYHYADVQRKKLADPCSMQKKKKKTCKDTSDIKYSNWPGNKRDGDAM